MFEVTPENEIVWKFANPLKPMTSPSPTAGGPPKRFEAIRRAARDAMGMTSDQRKKLDEIDGELVKKLDKILTAEQLKSFAEPNPGDVDLALKRPPGEYLAVFDRSTPEVTDAQRKELRALQKDFSQKIATVLTDAQKTQSADYKAEVKKRQLDAAAGRGPSRKAGNTLFRATRYALDHPAFAGRTLTPGKTLVELQQELDRPQPTKETRSEKLKTADASR